MKVAVVDLTNKKTGEIELSDAVFGVEVRTDLMARCVNWQRDKMQAGTHKTKGIAEVSGTGKKPFAQKGTGRARSGSNRRPQDRGGAVIFGPVVRSHATDLPKKVRVAALKSALSSKAKEQKIVIVSEATAKTHKTKDMASVLTKLGLNNALIMFEGELDTNFDRALSNIPLIDTLPQKAANVLDILAHDTLVLTKDAVAQLEERLK